MEERIKQHYDLLVEENNDPFRDPPSLKNYMNKWDGDALLSLLALSCHHRVLEIGVGTGRLAGRVLPLCKELVGLDLSKKSLERARENCPQENFHTVLVTFPQYEDSEGFDRIYSSLTWFHISQKEAAAEQVARLLKPGGRFVVSIDCVSGDRIDYGNRSLPLYPDTPQSVRQWLRKAGLVLVASKKTEHAMLFAAEKPMPPYRDLNTHLRSVFGKKTYKISLSMPFTCPNRDGTVGKGGCIFCSAQGSGNFAADARKSVEEQLEEGKKRVAGKIKNSEDACYVAYFQAFSSTYGDLSLQREMFSAAVKDPQVVALSVATRPDCLPDEVLDLLEEMQKVKPVWVELGFQTAKEETARLINRCYENSVFLDAVERLEKRGLEIIVHLILGLPGETHEDELESLSFVSKLPISGIKFHLLHLLRGTALEKMNYTPLSMEEYLSRVTDLLWHTPPHVVIHRLTGDGDKKELIAPLWSANKRAVLNALSKKIRESGKVQGSEWNPF